MRTLGKIAIVTWTKWNNYGTILQSYALYSILREWDYDVKVLNDKYISSSECISKYGIPTRFQYLKSEIKKFFTKRDSIEQIIYERERKCNKSKHKLIQYCTKNVDYKHLHLLEKQFDAFICGSDQIWTPDESFFDPYYFLSFVKNKPKIAYAPSIGRTSYPEEKRSQIATLLTTFRTISAREETGKQILTCLTDKPIHVCIDPTLLLESKKWITKLNLTSCTNSSDNNYVLCYYLGENDWYRKKVDTICNEKNLRKIVIPWLEKDIANIPQSEIIIPDPIKFLELILNASYIFTDSFHGFIFSLLFHKEVFVFARFSDKDIASQNSRVKDFCKKLNLNERYININDKFNLNDKINYQYVDDILNELREDSISYLKNSLKGIH